MLLLCLLVAGVFAWLGQWQLERAIETDPPAPGATEQVLPLTEVLEPGEYLPEPLVGQRVETSGAWVPEDFLVVSSRFNDDVQGYWVTGQLRVDEGVSIAVAIGWAPDQKSADAAVKELEASADGSEVAVSGRIISDEGPRVPPHANPEQMDRMSPAALLSRWHDIEQHDVYRPYLASTTAMAGLADISSPAPDEISPVNWLNVFYAVEWAIFAGFAFYLWYRLAKDAWEREVEEFEEQAAAEAV
jgi:cytochrome oxidase assembly protein ShyY1